MKFDFGKVSAGIAILKFDNQNCLEFFLFLQYCTHQCANLHHIFSDGLKPPTSGSRKSPKILSF